jgi:PAS domain S-box-containing protein
MPVAVSRAVIEVLLDRVQQGAAALSPEGRIAYANQRLAALLGQSRAQLVGKPFADLVAPADREALAAALANGRDGTSQCRLAMPRVNGGSEVQALLTFAPLGHGQASCLVSDLTQASEATALAHEVRRMLGAVRDSLELLRRSSLDPEAQRALATLERLHELLNSREQAPQS